LDVRCEATPLARGGILARLLCETAPTLHQTAQTLWTVTRRQLLGLNAISLRKL
jgi:hypothetical protein